jgi:large subunit ribosomal protein L30
MSKKFSVKLKKSKIGCTQDQIRTIEAIGLRKINSVVELADNPANRGQLYKVQHLVEIVVIK